MSNYYILLQKDIKDKEYTELLSNISASILKKGFCIINTENPLQLKMDLNSKKYLNIAFKLCQNYSEPIPPLFIKPNHYIFEQNTTD